MDEAKSKTRKIERELVDIRTQWDTVLSTTDSILSNDPNSRMVISFPDTSELVTRLQQLEPLIEEVRQLVTAVEDSKRNMLSIKIDQIIDEKKTLSEQISQKELEKKDYIYRQEDANRKNEERVGMRQTRMGLYAKESESLRTSESLVNDISSNIEATVFMLEDQGSRLSHTQIRWNELTSVLGLSRTVMNLISSRNKGDRILVYGGLLGIVVILFLIYYFLKR
ncbi:hypothetical protein EIN_268240 [Entamoeba invadens IP1]|uniref:Uncharacterized protein n=1 Tax=Entamoeba invadens IP1 TaxID=370355 RepID=A0A0A1U851_ENTIV|nr:hypothetical protein EIN_268240 [Entamoeba invadens IP1]ELP91078.1 hypothetical protein EIN_268240 [Entamoeba invadens IP1]|eukprot:XP_004257849.1 hypothetical protein EIN_268240 [Entamoeba invadens IP1]